MLIKKKKKKLEFHREALYNLNEFEYNWIEWKYLSEII